MREATGGTAFQGPWAQPQETNAKPSAALCYVIFRILMETPLISETRRSNVYFWRVNPTTFFKQKKRVFNTWILRMYHLHRDSQTYTHTWCCYLFHIIRLQDPGCGPSCGAIKIHKGHLNCGTTPLSIEHAINKEAPTMFLEHADHSKPYSQGEVLQKKKMRTHRVALSCSSRDVQVSQEEPHDPLQQEPLPRLRDQNLTPDPCLLSGQQPP